LTNAKVWHGLGYILCRDGRAPCSSWATLWRAEELFGIRAAVPAAADDKVTRRLAARRNASDAAQHFSSFDSVGEIRDSRGHPRKCLPDSHGASILYFWRQASRLNCTMMRGKAA